MTLSLLKIYLRYVLRRSMHQVVLGRYIDPQKPESGRFNHQQLNAILDQIWHNFEELTPKAHVQQYKRFGNRVNVLLSVLSLAGYRAFVEAGIDRDYAIQLFADTGWRLYTSMIVIPRFFARIMSRVPQKQMNYILRTLLRFPFGYGSPGYQGKHWIDENGFHTHWYRCPPLDFFRENGNREDMDFFYKTWCTYDYAIAKEMAPGGQFERPHTLSRGDNVCDMCWYVQKRVDEQV